MNSQETPRYPLLCPLQCQLTSLTTIARNSRQLGSGVDAPFSSASTMRVRPPRYFQFRQEWRRFSRKHRRMRKTRKPERGTPRVVWVTKPRTYGSVKPQSTGLARPGVCSRPNPNACTRPLSLDVALPIADRRLSDDGKGHAERSGHGRPFRRCLGGGGQFQRECRAFAHSAVDADAAVM
jgi:hypothetical protein